MRGAIESQDALLFSSNIHKHNVENDSSFLLSNINPKGSLLDVGFGTGYFLKKASHLGFNLTGIEKSQTLFAAHKDELQQHNIKIYRDDFATWTNEQHFEIITMSFFLHHTDDFHIHIQKSANHLCKNGRLYILDRIAICDSDKESFKIYWESEYKHQHEWQEEIPRIFTQGELASALTATGFAPPTFIIVPNDKRNEARRFPKTLAIAKKST